MVGAVGLGLLLALAVDAGSAGRRSNVSNPWSPLLSGPADYRLATSGPCAGLWNTTISSGGATLGACAISQGHTFDIGVTLLTNFTGNLTPPFQLVVNWGGPVSTETFTNSSWAGLSNVSWDYYAAGWYEVNVSASDSDGHDLVAHAHLHLTFDNLTLDGIGVSTVSGANGSGAMTRLNWTVTGGVAPFSARLDWGDGATSDVTNSSFSRVGSADHVYAPVAAPRVYFPTLLVTDGNGTQFSRGMEVSPTYAWGNVSSGVYVDWVTNASLSMVVWNTTDYARLAANITPDNASLDFLSGTGMVWGTGTVSMFLDIDGTVSADWQPAADYGFGTRLGGPGAPNWILLAVEGPNATDRESENLTFDSPDLPIPNGTGAGGSSGVSVSIAATNQSGPPPLRTTLTATVTGATVPYGVVWTFIEAKGFQNRTGTTVNWTYNTTGRFSVEATVYTTGNATSPPTELASATIWIDVENATGTGGAGSGGAPATSGGGPGTSATPGPSVFSLYRIEIVGALVVVAGTAAVLLLRLRRPHRPGPPPG